MPENEHVIAFNADILNELTNDDPSQISAKKRPLGAILLAVDLGKFNPEQSLEELSALAEAAGIEVLSELLQKREKPEPATMMGTGKLAQAKLYAQNLSAQLAIFDGELSGSQLRNIEKRLEIPVIDRTMLILQIFSSRAISMEGKIQTELATLEYRLPRLSGHGTSLSRQGGGGGGGGGARRGKGETKLEYDRRYIKERISVLKKRLAEVQCRRNETRKARTKSGVPLVALVGYTNVGKSSLVNALSGSEIMAADMLFATLDPTARHLSLPNGQNVVLVDTVGFVSRLPHSLVDAFKSTLEEVKYADLLLTVCNAASTESAAQLEVTKSVLESIGINSNTPQIIVYNKCDLVPNFIAFANNSAAVSANTGQGLPQLLNAIEAKLSARMCNLQIILPYNKMALGEFLRKNGTVLQEDFRDDGVFYKVSLEAEKAHLFTPYIFNQNT